MRTNPDGANELTFKWPRPNEVRHSDQSQRTSKLLVLSPLTVGNFSPTSQMRKRGQSPPPPRCPEWRIESVWILKIDWLPRTGEAQFTCTLINIPARQNVAVSACQPIFRHRSCARSQSDGAKLSLLVGGFTNNRLTEGLTDWLAD